MSADHTQGGTPADPDQPKPDSPEYLEALSYLYDRLNYERLASGSARYPFRLHRTAQLLDRLGLRDYLATPWRCESAMQQAVDDSDGELYCRGPRAVPKVPLIHIAGTKGKGSTAAMIASILTASGAKVGLYTSPHLHRIEERFRIDGRPCHADELVGLVDRIKPVVAALIESGNPPPSFFEITTAMALMHFDASDCDAMVIETGLGGRLDSTNVCASSVTAITSIGLDHQYVLGNTIGEIAAEKAGIIKHGVPLVSGVTAKESADVIGARAAVVGVPTFQRNVDFTIDHQPCKTWGSRLTFHGSTDPMPRRLQCELPLEGIHQANNGALAIAVASILADSTLHPAGVDLPWRVTDESIARGIAAVDCSARVEPFVLGDGTLVILDAAHNEDSVDALCRCISQRRGQRRIAFVFGTSRDKSAEPMLRRIAEIADEVVLTQFCGNPRFTPAGELRAYVPENFAGQVTVVEDALTACKETMKPRPAAPSMIVICGSFFLAGELRPWLQQRVGDSP
ncbi:bifunctional folylpolyglutamate synthase/dihydrofolate synthase [Stieleria varia]|uniref:bifunctional folylpolyglutamate synthase/dihydrofolate synthase n=1 Tax=Stieleria varia TaxID=2528005 RepID=UPI0011B46F32|nr:folylpolyglutamate synthase/dihydrofolate synthase family protein [Stieleria varia]